MGARSRLRAWLRLHLNDAGATLVEFALALPLFLLLVFGLIEFGRYVAVSTAVETASREAARYASAVGGTPPQYTDCDAIRNAGHDLSVITDIDQIDIVYDSGPGTGSKLACQGPLWPLPTPGALSSGDRVVVTATESFQSVVPIIGNIIGTVTITSTDSRTIFKGSL